MHEPVALTVPPQYMSFPVDNLDPDKVMPVTDTDSANVELESNEEQFITLRVPPTDADDPTSVQEETDNSPASVEGP